MKKLLLPAILVLLIVVSGRAQTGYWNYFGTGNPFATADGIICMTYQNGKLYVPTFIYPDSICLFIWESGNWSIYTLPSAFDSTENFQPGDVNAIVIDSSGNVYMGGNFTDTSGAIVIKWDGSSFSKVGNGATGLHTNNGSGVAFVYNEITGLCFDGAGNLYTGGYFADAAGNNYVAKWDGSSWTSLPTYVGLMLHTYTEAMSDVNLSAYGNNVYCTTDRGLVVWNGTAWSVVVDSFPVHSFPVFVIGKTGNIYASQGTEVLKWDGSTWATLGTFQPYYVAGTIEKLYLDSAENVYITGQFRDSLWYYFIAEWNGSTWNELGTNNLALHANGLIFAIGSIGENILAGGWFGDGFGDAYLAEYQRFAPGQMFAFPETTPANCGNNGAIATQVYNGTPPYHYSWSNGATTANIGSLTNGMYYLTVTDSTGQVAIADAFVQGGCFSVVSGVVFLDTAGTCSYTGTQPGIPGVILTLSGGSQTLYATTDSNGHYSFDVAGDSGSYYIYIQVGDAYECGNFTLCGDSSQVIVLNASGDSALNNNFGMYPSAASFDLYLHPGWTAAAPGEEKDYWIYFANNSGLPFTGTVTVTFKYDSNLIYLSSDTPYTTWNSSADSLAWVITDFNNSGWNYIGRIRFMVPPSLPLNYEIQSKFTIYPFTSDCDTSNNSLSYSDIIVGSHDPNYKEVSPQGNLTASDSVLTFTIHFENNGTDSTHFIIVTDTLSSYLNPSTVVNLASSASYTSFNISGSGLLTWVFSPYSLVDSATNPDGSKGFITFSVKRNINVDAGTEITNTALVYFDYNPAIATNTVTDSVLQGISITSLADTICAGDTFNFNGQRLTLSGSYNDTLTGISGFDSIITLTLVVTAPPASVFSDTICAGSSFAFKGQVLTQSGNYNDTLTSISGCDSIVTLILVVTGFPTSGFSDTICAGSSFTFNGQTLTVAGNYNDTLSTVNGCDSIVTLTLVVNPVATSGFSDTICAGSSFTFNGQTLTVAGNYNDTLSTVNGCDSIVTLTLVVNPVATSGFSDTICAGSSFTFDEQTLTAAGNYNDTLSTVNGCDSIVTLTLVVNPFATLGLNDTICAGDTITFNGKALTRSGEYNDTLAAISGCDSIITLNLVVTPPLTYRFTDTICGGNSYEFYGRRLTSSGTYHDTLTTALGCDSIITLALTVRSTAGAHLHDTICNGASFEFFGRSLLAGGTYHDTLTATVTGCDSIITLSLVVTRLGFTINDTMCAGAAYNFIGQQLYAPGTYRDTFVTAAGCDSIITLNLNVTPPPTVYFYDTVCHGASYNFNGQKLTVAGVYTDTFTIGSGCDSLVVLNLANYEGPAIPLITRVGDTLLSTGAVTYQWYLNDIALTGDSTQLITVTQYGNYSVQITDVDGCTGKSAEYAISPTGVESVQQDMEVKLYPNPNDGTFMLTFSNNATYQVSITDVLGDVIVSPEKVTGQKFYQFSRFAAGVYFVRINTGSEEKVLKFIIAK